MFLSQPVEAGAATAVVGGQVVDALSGRPIAAATVAMSRRAVRLDATGYLRLDDLGAAELVATTRSSATGEFSLRGIERGAIALLAVYADGYEPGFETMAPAGSGGESGATLALVPISLDAGARAILDARRIARREAMRAEPDPRFDGPPESVHRRGRVAPRPGASATEYPVPAEVFVVELGAARFTGFIAFDELVAGTVAAEMGDGFPASALRAQAVAARTYALERHERTGIASGGQAFTSSFSPQGKSAAAAAQTHARVVLAGGEPITAFYSARCNGDRTLDSEDGLSGTTTCVVGGLGVGALSYVRSRACSGHVSCALTTEPCCTVAIDGEVQHLFGHGVGLCQRGAQQLACRDGLGSDEIVERYYTGISIANPVAISIGTRVMATTALNTRADPCASPPVAVAAGTVGTVTSDAVAAFCPALGSCGSEPGSAWSWRRIDWDGGPTGRWSVEDFLWPLAPGACGPVSGCENGSCAPAELCDAVCETCRDGGCRSRCGIPQSEGEEPALNDVLYVLQAAVGFRSCADCLCDVTGDGRVGVTDALLLLGIVTGGGGEVLCPQP